MPSQTGKLTASSNLNSDRYAHILRGVSAAPASIKGNFHGSNAQIWTLISVTSCVCAMDFVTHYEYLTGTQNETVIKDLFIADENGMEIFQIRSPYALRRHGDLENGMNWADGHIPYNQLYTVLSEGVAVFAHLYGIGRCSSLCNRCNGLGKLCGIHSNRKYVYNLSPTIRGYLITLVTSYCSKNNFNAIPCHLFLCLFIILL